jgi:hypothetical protein
MATASDRSDHRSDIPEWSSALNVVAGGAISIVTGPVPFSPVIGGTAAGFLDARQGRSGLRAGALSGLVALLPLALGFTLVASILSFGVAAGGPDAFGVTFLFGGFFLVVFLFSALYTVGLGALGGLVGADLARREAEGEWPF